MCSFPFPPMPISFTVSLGAKWLILVHLGPLLDKKSEVEWASATVVDIPFCDLFNLISCLIPVNWVIKKSLHLFCVFQLQINPLNSIGCSPTQQYLQYIAVISVIREPKR